ncbi:MAG: DUF4623 domain-containing protein [Bacteroidetes bacterium]|nr:MAG: DUF4623 domain-containing protein [Bacteroidota bacterium]
MKKSKLFQLLGLILVISFTLNFTSCSDDDDPLPVEALITEFAITNAGGAGDLRIEGVISDFNILVVVPFETDVTALVTDIKLSEGASVVPASGTPQDFSTTRNFVVTNQDVSNTYQVTVELAEPTTGVITDIEIVSSVTLEAYATDINQGDRIINVTFNELQSTLAIIESISLQPAGTTYTTSSGTDTLDLSQDQSITLSFAGEQTVYTVTAHITEAGFNPDNTTLLLDKSSASGLVPTIISNENNRGAAFDGRYVYVTSRQDGNHVYIWDLQNPTADPQTLDFGGVVSGGTWMVSDIRVIDGSIYVSNMVMAEGGVFKVYKWDGIDDDSPETILEYTVPAADIRLGDAISIIGNPPANGYIFASNFAFPNNASEFYVWDFNGGKTDTPQIMPITPIEGLRMGQYGRVNTIPGDPDHLLVTGAEMGIAVMDFNGDVKYEVSEPMIQTRSFDPRVWEYNGGLYLSYTVNREWEANGAWYEIINVTEGASLIDALQGLNETSIDEKRVFKHQLSGPGLLWVGGTNGVGFSGDGKPRVMGFALMHGFIVHEFSN